MKLTWFGGTTMRLHIGGQILVLDPDGAPGGIDAAELVSGADRVIAGQGADLPAVELARWTPRRPGRLVDEDAAPQPVEAWSAGPGTVLIEAVGEPPLLLVSEAVPSLGRWAEAAVVVVSGEDGEQLARLAQAVLEDRPPRLLALASHEMAVDAAMPLLRDRLEGSGLVALEAGLALEI
ncbi:MAG TPA: hypothetical protein VGN60_07070 [Devosia sp.]|jgi:hypothetical protein|nr:hypothetical protein [Devosia sp.]